MPTMNWLRGTLRLTRRVFVDFHRNRGFLLAGAIAYNALLSLLPLIAVIFAVVSLFFDRELLVSILNDELNLLIPGATSFAEEADSLFENRDLIGGVGAIVLLVFCTFAFRALEEAFAIIFRHAQERRSFWVSALLPLLFILLLMASLFVITGVTVLIDTAAANGVQVLGRHWTVPDASGAVIYYGGFVGVVLLFTAIYWVMPASRIKVRRALVGGTIAALLWELVRRTMVWYFNTVSMVNVIYGSAATIVFILLSFEAAAIILLLGAQIIAELELLDKKKGIRHTHD